MLRRRFLLAASRGKATQTHGQIVGICVDFSVSPPTVQRLTTSGDPNGLVTRNIMTEPVPAIGSGGGSSPFDSIYPWKEMAAWNIVDGRVTVKQGQPGFSETEHDTVVFIPPFYYRVVDDAASKRRCYYIADAPAPGFARHPGSGRCVGKYDSNSQYESKSGFAPVTGITRKAGREGHKARGDRYALFDFASLCASQLLYLTEFADWDSQTMVGRGNVDNSSKNVMKSGLCDAMTYHTGRPEGTNGKTGVLYRGIENLWGNVFEWVDGLNANGGFAYVCTNPASFADDVIVNYINTGISIPLTGNWISGYGFSADAPWALIPNASNDTEAASIGDQIYANQGKMNFRASGGEVGGSKSGLFYFNTSTNSSYSAYNLGVRMMYIPTENEIEMMSSKPQVSKILSENTWAQIAAVSAAGNAENYWKVGDEIDIVVNGETLTLQIYGFHHDDLTGGGKAGITFGMKNLMAETRRMNSSNTNAGSFTGSEMYDWLTNTLFPALPEDLRGLIQAVDKKTSAGDKSTTILTESMKLFLFSPIENGLRTTTNVYKDEGKTYPIFTGNNSRIKRLANGAGSAYTWQERSPNATTSTNFCNVNSAGSASNSTASNSYGVCFGFCI